MFMCKCMCMCMCMYMCMCKCMCMCIRICICTLYVYYLDMYIICIVYVYVCYMYITCIHICIYLCICICLCICISNSAIERYILDITKFSMLDTSEILLCLGIWITLGWCHSIMNITSLVWVGSLSNATAHCALDGWQVTPTGHGISLYIYLYHSPS